MPRKIHFLVWITILILVSLACGSLQVGVVAPNTEGNPDLAAETQEPTPEMGISISLPPEELTLPIEEPEEDFSYLWMEYRDPRYSYGVALPTHWTIYPTPADATDGAMSTSSFDEAYFLAHATKGWWTDGVIPEGVIKMDFAGISDEYPELDLAASIKAIYSQAEETVLLSTEPVVYNNHEAVLLTTASPNHLEETYTTVAFRLPNDKILLVTVYWGDVFTTPDVQAILNSFAFEGEPVTLPNFAPYPPLSSMPDDSGSSNPVEPGALPASGSCESGYLGSVEEAIELIQYNLEIGNYYPFSYFIGNPFVIGYWRSEGVALPREEAYQHLIENYLPSPEEVIVITDPAQFPNLEGMPLDSFWGPDVDVAANLYSKGWGPDGQGEAILVVARCIGASYDTYYWYGMLYAGGGFE